MKYLKLILIVGIIIVLLFFFLKDVDFKEVMAIISSVDLIYPVIFFFGLLLQYFVRAYRWGLLLRPHKEKIPLMTMYSYTVIGFLLNLLPGKVGEPARGILLANEIKISRSYGLASVVLERLIDMFMLLVLFMVALFFMPPYQAEKLAGLKNISLIVFSIDRCFFYYVLPAQYRPDVWLRRKADPLCCENCPVSDSGTADRFCYQFCKRTAVKPFDPGLPETDVFFRTGLVVSYSFLLDFDAGF